MPNMKKEKTPMPVQEPAVRARNFKEVALGYTKEDAMEEAARCLNCKNPFCMTGCPVKVHIPDFLQEVAKGDFDKAYEVLSLSTSLPAVCGRVCPQESQCEKECIRGKKGESVGIGRVERFVADYHNEHGTAKPQKAESNGHRVAIVGSGPAGLTCAGDLAKAGFEVTIFEALHTPGGVLTYGIPEFRLPKSIVAKEIENLKELGVKIETDVIIGKTVMVDDLQKEFGFEAVFIGSGAGLPNFMNLPGENLNGVLSANEFLTRNNLMKAYLPGAKTPIPKAKNAVIVGGGNVAMDAARTALRLGADSVKIVYRRTREDLPARLEEIEHAMEEGIEFLFLTNPVEIIGYSNPEDRRDPKNGSVIGMKCVKMEQGEPDASGRRRPVPIEGSEFVIDCDLVVMSIGTSPNPLILSTTPGLEATRKGGIAVDENGKSSQDGIYAGGDAVTGAATVILAMGAGKTAAKAIQEKILG